MVTPQEPSHPYAAPSNVIAVIQRARTRNLPEAINNDFLRIAGMPEAVFGRVTQTLRFLGLLHEDGRPTDALRTLAAAPDAEYRQLFANVVRTAYRPDFDVVDPAQDTQARILDAFRPYQPRSQTNRMVMLFLGLCREAGIPVLEAPRQRSMTNRSGSRRRSTSTRSRNHEPSRGGAFTSGSQDAVPHAIPGLLFGVTESDIGMLDDSEFNEVWAALGRVARARARANTGDAESQSEPSDDQEEPDNNNTPV